MRLKIIRIIVIGVFLLVTGELTYLQVLRGQYYYNLSKNNRIRVVPVRARRGRILDRNGLVLAGNRLSFDISVIPQDVKDEEELFDYLADVLDEGREGLLKKYRRKIVTPGAGLGSRAPGAGRIARALSPR